MNLSKNHLIILGAALLALVGFGLFSIFQPSPVAKKTPPDPGAESRQKYQGQSTSTSAPPASPDGEGDIGILPEGSAITEPLLEEGPVMPKIEVADTTVREEKKEVTQAAAAPPPAISFFDTSPPEEAEKNKTDLLPAEIRTKPGYYLFNNFTPQALGGQSVLYQASTPPVSINHFAPAGESIEIALMANVAGNNFEVPVAAAVWNPFYFRGNKLLETGDKLIGKAGQKTRDRLLVQFNKVVFKDGRTLPINAIGLDLDGTNGIKGYVIGDRLLQDLGIIVTRSLGEFMSELTDRKFDEETDTETTEGDLKSAIGEALNEASERIEKTLEEELEENRPYVLVPAGTRAKAYLLNPIDVSKAQFGQ